MTDIPPPSELAAKWVAEIYGDPVIPLHPVTLRLVERAAQWGADQELEACLCEVSFLNSSALADRVREKRRPKPSPFQEQSVTIAELENRVETLKHQLDTLRADYLRMANAVANQLPDRSKFFVDFMKDAS